MNAREARRFLLALRLALRVQTLARFPQVYIGVAIAIGLLVRLLAGEWAERLVPVFLLGEPGTLGVFLVAGHRYYDRNQGADVALRVTPLPDTTAIAAPVLATALMGTAAGLVIQAIALGVDARLLLLVPPLLLTVTLSGLLGWLLMDVFSEFTHLLLGGILPVLIISLPYATHFGWLPPLALVWLPTQWAMTAFADLAGPSPDPALWAACCAGLAAVCGGGMLLARGRFQARGPASLETA